MPNLVLNDKYPRTRRAFYTYSKDTRIDMEFTKIKINYMIHLELMTHFKNNLKCVSSWCNIIQHETTINLLNQMHKLRDKNWCELIDSG